MSERSLKTQEMCPEIAGMIPFLSVLSWADNLKIFSQSLAHLSSLLEKTMNDIYKNLGKL